MVPARTVFPSFNPSFLVNFAGAWVVIISDLPMIVMIIGPFDSAVNCFLGLRHCDCVGISLSGRVNLQGPSRIAGEDGLDGGEERQLAVDLIHSSVGPVADETDLIAVEELGGDLLDGGLFEVGGERGLAGGDGVAGHDVAACIGYAALLHPISKPC